MDITKFGGDSVKKLLSIIIKTELFGIIFTIFTLCFKLASIGVTGFAEGVLPIVFGNWYIITYILLFPLIPYANKFIQGLSQEEFKKLLLTIAIIYCIVPTFTLNMMINNFGGIAILIFTYFIGAYIRLFCNSLSTKKWLFLSIVGFVSMIIINMSILGIGYIQKSDRIISQSCRFSEYNTIPAMLFSIGIFITFLKIKVNSEIIGRVVTLIGKSTFGIYLIHINTPAKFWLWNKPFDYFYSNSMPYLGAFIQIIVVFAFCSIVDTLYELTISKIIKRALFCKS